MISILGILNVTRDSFSDGGRYIDTTAAVEHARRMFAEGAEIIDVGAESTHPNAESVDANEEMVRLTPVISRLVDAGIPVSVDTSKPEVMRRVVELGATIINDVTGFRAPGSIEAVRDSDVRLIVMHSRALAARAESSCSDLDVAADPTAEIMAWFGARIGAMVAGGIACERIIVDPGMGFFLGATAGPSLRVLRELARVRRLGFPVCVSTSRKSFIGAVLGCPVGERGAGTLATELWAAMQGVDFIRTHDVRACRDAIRMVEAIRGS